MSFDNLTIQQAALFPLLSLSDSTVSERKNLVHKGSLFFIIKNELL